MEELVTREDLIAAVPIPGTRPEVTLKRLRRAGLVVAPRRPGQGRGKGRAALYPRETIARIREILRLRQLGVRSMRELRWVLWWAGDDGLWPSVRTDLLAAYPRAEQAAVNLRFGTDTLLDDIDRASVELGAHWRRSRHRAYDRRRVRSEADVNTIAHTLISAAVEPAALEIDEPVDAGEPTTAVILDEAFGQGAADALASAAQAGVTDASNWEASLASATATTARRVADLWRRTFEPQDLSREFRFFGRQWGDRALLFAVTASAVQAGLVSSD